MYAYYIQGRHDARDFFEAHKHEHVSRETFIEESQRSCRSKKLQTEKADLYMKGWLAVCATEKDYFDKGL